MWFSVLGNRKIGKSIFVERLIENSRQKNDNVLYIATLPFEPIYYKTIRSHRMRRPSDWDCIELFDMKINDILEYPYNNYRFLLLDNLSYYLIYHLCFNDSIFNLKNFELYKLVIDRISKHNCYAYIVDSPILDNKYDNVIKLIVHNAINYILKLSKVITWYGENDNVTNITYHTAIERFITYL